MTAHCRSSRRRWRRSTLRDPPGAPRPWPHAGVLADLVGDLRDLNYPTAFTLARAQVPGVNLAFERLGFELRGRMTQSCRIGTDLEDMNVWSQRLREEDNVEEDNVEEDNVEEDNVEEVIVA